MDNDDDDDDDDATMLSNGLNGTFRLDGLISTRLLVLIGWTLNADAPLKNIEHDVIAIITSTQLGRILFVLRFLILLELTLPTRFDSYPSIVCCVEMIGTAVMMSYVPYNEEISRQCQCHNCCILYRFPVIFLEVLVL